MHYVYCSSVNIYLLEYIGWLCLHNLYSLLKDDSFCLNLMNRMEPAVLKKNDPKQSHISTRGRVMPKCLVAVIVASSCLTGCLESDVLVNKVVNQESDNVDYNNPQKKYVYDAKADLSIEDAQVKYNMSAEDIEKVVEDLPSLDTKGNTNKKAKDVKKGKADDESSKAPKAQDSDDANETEGVDKDSKEKGTSNSKKSKKSKRTDDKSDNGAEADEEDVKGDDSKVHYSQYGDVSDLPEDVDTVCAVDNAAIAVLSVAGEGHLVGCDSKLRNGTQSLKVLASKGLKDAKVCWKNNGTSSKDVDIDSIIKLKPDAVLTVSGTNTLSKKNQDRLTSKGIQVIVLPAFNSDSNIKLAVKAVGKLFTKATNNASVQKATDYSKAASSILKTAKDTHGGKVVSYGETDFDNVDGTTTTTGTMTPSYWTVYIAGWDDNATVTASFQGKTLFKETGVAYTKIGWKSSPLSYYMGCGGVLNNAAVYGLVEPEKGYRLFLTYNENEVRYTWSNLSSSIKQGNNGGTFNGGNSVLSNGYDAVASTDDNSIHYLGSSDFNTVIVKTSKIKSKLTAARKKSQGLYSMCTYQNGGTASTSGYGYRISGTLLHSFSVGKDKDGKDVTYKILVNPSGMASSWTDGSMESCLESLWVASKYYGYSEKELKEKIKDFYSEFYGYEPTQAELDKILNGDYA